MNYEALRSEALLHAGKARTMAAKLFNDPQASQVDAGDLLISMAQLVDLLCVAATPAPAPLTDEQIDEMVAVASIAERNMFRRFARAVERAHGIGASTKESNQ